MFGDFSVRKFVFENLFDCFQYVFCMAFCFCKEKRFWNHSPIFFSVRVQRLIDGIFICLNNRFDLCRNHDTSVYIRFGELPVFMLLLRFSFTAPVGNFFDFFTVFNGAAAFRDFGFNSIHTRRNINAVGNGFFQSIIYYSVFIKKSFSFRCRSCRQSDDFCIIKIGKNLPPISVNRTMTFINYNYVKEIRR